MKNQYFIETNEFEKIDPADVFYLYVKALKIKWVDLVSIRHSQQVELI